MNVIKSLKKNNFFCPISEKNINTCTCARAAECQRGYVFIYGCQDAARYLSLQKKGKEKAQGEESENVRFFAQQQQQQQKKNTHTHIDAI